LRKAGFGDMALELRRDIDIAIDMILPPNDYTGDSTKDLPGIREGWDRAGNAAKLAAYSSFGYDPKLSSSQVLQRLEDIVTGNTPEELQKKLQQLSRIGQGNCRRNYQKTRDYIQVDTSTN